ncbi:MAG: sensor histidine kinase [Clostridia bacterium]
MNISIVALVLAAVISNMLLAFKLIKNQQQKEELNKQKELMELKESFLQQMAAEQHDFAKHLRAIKSLLNVSEDRERRSEAAAYVEELIAEREGKKSMMYAGDGILSAILHDKRKEAERKGVAFHVLARQTEKKLPLSQTELVELVVNLLDNAFEAVERMETERRKVFFEIGERRGTVFLQTINSLPEESPAAEQMLERGVSTKRGHLRGYGLANVKNIVEAHGGRLEIQKNDEIIVIRVLFQ